jgi:hypothetical protein
MENPKCPKCQGASYKHDRDALLDSERSRTAYSIYHAGRAKTPHEALIKYAIAGTMIGARWTLSRVYSCYECNYKWRVWF